MRRRENLPGDTLYEIAEMLFGANAFAQSLFALIADFQQEWTGTTSGVDRAWLRVRLLLAFWHSVMLHTIYRATRPPSARAAAGIALAVVLSSTTMGAMQLWLTRGDWHEVIRQILSGMTLWVAIPLSNARDTFMASVPERERWRTFHQFAVFWVLLATLWTIGTGVPGWLPILTAANAIGARAVAAWLQHRRDRRAAKG